MVLTHHRSQRLLVPSPIPGAYDFDLQSPQGSMRMGLSLKQQEGCGLLPL